MSAPCLSPSCERMLLPGQGITVGTEVVDLLAATVTRKLP